jgi:predicted membrane protein
MGILVLATILIWAAKVLDHFTLLWAEWVSLFIIAAYLIMMAASQLKYEDR